MSCTFGLSCSGHMSTMPVTRDSTIQNSESMPMVTSMKKNTTAQIDPPGNFNTTWVIGIVIFRVKGFENDESTSG